jgi:ribonuclease P protein component
MQKEYRLTKNEQFRSIYKHGKSVANRQLVLYYMQNQEVSHFRLGVTVSKKLGKAVVRNRIKRVVKEVVRHNAGHNPHRYDLFPAASWTLVVARHGFARPKCYPAP